MIKIQTKKKATEYIIELYNTISKNIRYDNEYYAILDIVEKMYTYNPVIATKWSLELLNKYGEQGLGINTKNDSYSVIYTFIDTLLIYMLRYQKTDDLIKTIHHEIKNYSVRFLIWSFLFDSNCNSNFKNLFDELIASKKYQDAYDTISLVLDNQNYIPIEIFDSTTFLNNLINSYTKHKEKIKNQQILDLLYSLTNLVQNDYSQAVLKSNFINYI